MGKARINGEQYARIANGPNGFDDKDKEILGLMLSGFNNREIASKLKIPMSTVQRRTRRLFEKGIIKNKTELDYKKLGFRKGLLHVYLNDGNVHAAAEMVSKIKGILATSIHIGNSDVLGFFVFKEADHLLTIMSEAKKIEGVERVVWSEEVASMPESNGKFLLEQLK
jgi:Lrp/AsnC family transcriptional regulator, regulator for asnA, asnC and gidA